MEQKPKYKEEQESRYTARTVAILAELPEFCTTFYCELTLSAKKKRFNDQYGLRDEIIYQILKETEIRLSELAELNIRDFDLKNHRFYVYRTKQRSTWISMSDELTDLIEKYLEERSAYAFEKDAEAVFLVTIGRYKGARLGVRSIERIVITIRKRQL